MIKIYISHTIQTDVISLIKQLYEQKITICVYCIDEQTVQEHSKVLWNNRVFLPHAIAGDAKAENMTQAEWMSRQMIFVTAASNNPNAASACIYIDHYPTILQRSQYTIFFCHAENNMLLSHIKANHITNESYKKNKNIWEKID